MRSRQLHDALEKLTKAIREVEAIVETMRRHPVAALSAIICTSPVADLPNSRCVIPAGSHDELTVWTESRAVHIPCVFAQLSQPRPSARLPHARRAVAAGSDDQLAIWAESGIPDYIAMFKDVADVFSGSCIPDARRAVTASGDHHSPIWTEPAVC